MNTAKSMAVFPIPDSGNGMAEVEPGGGFPWPRKLRSQALAFDWPKGSRLLATNKAESFKVFVHKLLEFWNVFEGLDRGILFLVSWRAFLEGLVRFRGDLSGFRRIVKKSQASPESD